MNIKKGDTVKILYGKDSGKTGVVLSVLTKKDKVLVMGLNKVTRHIKGDGKTRKSEIVNIERPIVVAKLMIVCPSCSKPTRIGYKVNDNGSVRICKKCGKEFEKVSKKETKSEKTEEKKTVVKKTKSNKKK